ncbi:MAG: SH3 domain-containing protein [Treponema sp.]|jgi:hypothetical protein|nr:SH3 domain-containing protein [Treponema sp.]
MQCFSFIQRLKGRLGSSEMKEADGIPQRKPSLRLDKELELIPNKKYRLTRQMYLFPEQEVSPQINDYLKIGAVVTYLKSGELVEGNNKYMPWVYVRSEKQKKPDMGRGQEGWCFSHYLQMIEAEEAGV